MIEHVTSKLYGHLVLRAAPSLSPTACRRFSTSPAMLKNRIYPAAIRRESDLESLTLMSASTRIPLITLWTTNWCGICKTVSPLLRQLIEKERVGEEQGGVSFVEVEMDSPDMGGIGGLPMRYGINSIPTLLSFDRQEPQLETKVSKLDELKNKEFLRRWIEKEAARQGSGGSGGRFMGLFGR